MPSETSTAPHVLPVHLAEGFRVCFGTNEGDALSIADDLLAGDFYELGRAARLQPLTVLPGPQGSFRIARHSLLGQPGAALHLDCRLGFICPDGHLHDVLVFVELDRQGFIAQIYLLPLHPLRPDAPYHLMEIDRQGARRSFARLGSASFLRGTRITLPSGDQRPIEAVRPGDLVLTRNEGPQQVRWVSHHCVRAAGALAPIRIAAGALHNSRDLLLSPDHRLFVYQRSDALGAGRAEVMVRAQDLLGSAPVSRMAGGFVDYFQLVFDRHQIIYAEGIAAETMLVDDRTVTLLPSEVAARLAGRDPGPERRSAAGIEIGKGLFGRRDPVTLLRDASLG